MRTLLNSALALLLLLGGCAHDSPRKPGPSPRVPKGEIPYLYGFHDPGGEDLMIEAGVPGWIVFTERLLADPDDRGGADYSRWSDAGIGVLVRLNYDYHPYGNLPRRERHDSYLKRCVNFVAASRGARHWIIGNETNFKHEWPQNGGNAEPITAETYVRFFREVRAAIKSLPGHENDVVVVQGVAVHKNDSGDWLKYFKDVLEGIGRDADAIALHTYASSHDPALVTSDEKDDKGRHKEFRTYIDLMNAIPENLRDRPVYITETDGGEEWFDANNGWVKEAYVEIDRWNRTPGAQKIRALCLYRWPPYDSWEIEGKPGVIEDFKQALEFRYRWDR